MMSGTYHNMLTLYNVEGVECTMPELHGRAGAGVGVGAATWVYSVWHDTTATWPRIPAPVTSAVQCGSQHNRQPVVSNFLQLRYNYR